MSNSTAMANKPTVDSLMYGVTVAQCGISSVGLIINGFLVYTILRNKQLRSTSCFLLILLLAVCDCVNELAQFLPTALTLTGTTIPLLTCFYTQGYGLFALTSAMWLLLMISVDRLASIVFPIGYKHVSTEHKRKYMCCLLALPVSVSLYFTMAVYHPYVLTDPAKQVFCQTTDYIGPIGNTIGFNALLFVFVSTFAVYSSIWLLITCKFVKIVQTSAEQHLLRSLYVLMAVTIFCWLPAPVLISFVFPNLEISADAKNVSSRIVLQLNKMAQAANGLVLFFCSSQYRRAMQKELGRLIDVQWTSSSSNNSNDSRVIITYNTGSTAAPAQQNAQQQQHRWANSQRCATNNIFLPNIDG